MNAIRPTWELLGFADDADDLHGSMIDGLPVIGPIGMVPELADVRVVVCTGSPRNYWSRAKLVNRLGLASERFATILHPAAVIPPATAIGPGTVVLATSVATVNVRIGAHVAVMPGAVLTHDDDVEDYATLGSGVRLAGGVTVGRNAYIGAGALVRENVELGPGCLVGMGAVVLHDVPAHETWAGVPARCLGPAPRPESMHAGAVGVRP